MRQFLIDRLSEINFNFRFTSYERYRYSYQSDFPKSMHCHIFTEIFFVTDGKGYFHTNSKTFPIEKGTVVINNAGIMHAETPAAGHDLEYAVIHLENLSFFDRTEQSEIRSFIFDFRREYTSLFAFIRKIEYEWMVRDEYWDYAIQINLEEMLLFILRNSRLFSKKPDSFAKPHSLAEIYEYLTSRYQDDITLGKLCEIFKVNKYTLSHTFKAEYGDSVISCLNHIRCETARVLLMETDKPVGIIAFEVGYNSEPYFCKMYKKIIGVSPLETRKRYINAKKGTEAPPPPAAGLSKKN